MALRAVRLRCCLMTSCESRDVLPTCRGIGGVGLWFVKWDMAKEWLTAVKMPAKSGVCIKERAVPYRVISPSQHSSQPAAVISDLDCGWSTWSAILRAPPGGTELYTDRRVGPFVITGCKGINYMGLQQHSWLSLFCSEAARMLGLLIAKCWENNDDLREALKHLSPGSDLQKMKATILSRQVSLQEVGEAFSTFVQRNKLS